MIVVRTLNQKESKKYKGMDYVVETNGHKQYFTMKALEELHMKIDKELSIQRKPKIEIHNAKYRKVWNELEKYIETTWLELYKMNDWHFRIQADDENVLDIYPKRKKYCMVKETGVVNNRWGSYDKLIPFVEEFFKIK